MYVLRNTEERSSIKFKRIQTVGILSVSVELIIQHGDAMRIITCKI
jgi:hypothetical protein